MTAKVGELTHIAEKQHLFQLMRGHALSVYFIDAKCKTDSLELAQNQGTCAFLSMLRRLMRSGPVKPDCHACSRKTIVAPGKLACSSQRKPGIKDQLNQLIINSGSVFAHIVALAKFNAVMAQNGIGSRHVEEELWQAIADEIRLTGHFLLFRRAWT